MRPLETNAFAKARSYRKQLLNKTLLTNLWFPAKNFTANTRKMPLSKGEILRSSLSNNEVIYRNEDFTSLHVCIWRVRKSDWLNYACFAQQWLSFQFSRAIAASHNVTLFDLFRIKLNTRGISFVYILYLTKNNRTCPQLYRVLRAKHFDNL